MAIYNVTVYRHGSNPASVHGVDADDVEIGEEASNGERDNTLRFMKDGELVAAFYDWEWFVKSGADAEAGRARV